MPMPIFYCPCCRNPLTVELVFANDSVRESIVSLVDAHPEGAKLLRPLMGYISLFAPEKTAMRYERIATLLDEIVPMIRAAEVSRNGRLWVAPIAYWIVALNEIVARGHAGSIRRPLSSHGYLLEIIVGLSNKDESKKETVTEQKRQGVSGIGLSEHRQQQSVIVSEPIVRSVMPEHVRAELDKYLKRTPKTKQE